MPSGRMRSIDASRFSMVPRTDVPRSAFQVAHTHKTTFGAGALVPIYVDEVLPGDSIRTQMHLFARLSTAVVPVMDNLILESFFFFVPNRLLWDNWARFMGERADIADTTVYLTPQIAFAAADLVPGSIGDYLGIHTTAGGPAEVLALPFRAYNLVWNEFFRDQHVQNKVIQNTDDGPDIPADYTIMNRGKRHDYFTSARPWPQDRINAQLFSSMNAGNPNIPGQGFGFETVGGVGHFGAGAPVTGLGVTNSAVSVDSVGTTYKESGRRSRVYEDVFDSAVVRLESFEPAGATWPNVRVLVNDIRTANMIQVFLERNARGGTRLTELVRTHFGVNSLDGRLQRPEYLGGGRAFVSMNPIAQTSGTDATGTTTPLGEQSGVGMISASNHGFSQSFTEHGYILGLINVRADLTYQQGINRMWHRRTQFDFYWPALAHLGEQVVFRKEIYSTGVDVDDNLVFGYQERWAEYKYKPSRTSGMFRSTAATPLDVWHFAELFATPPALNDAFISQAPPVDRVLQVSGNYGQQFLVDSLFETRYVRCMPMYSIPGLGPRI